MLAGFCSIGGRCHSGWWEWDFGTLAQFSSWTACSQLGNSHSAGSKLVVMILKSGTPSLNSMGGQFSFLALYNLCSEPMRAWNFEILVENSNTYSPSSCAVWIGCLFSIFVSILICELCLKNDERKAESNIKWGRWGGGRTQ